MPLDLKKISILIVEDLAPMRALIKSVLEAFGVGKIYEASNGDEAYSEFQRHNPDIVITDWLMQPTNGLELIRKIRNERKSVNRLVPVIIITGYAAMQRVTQARDLGATEFLTKPFSGRDLARRINQIINKPRDFVETENFFGPDRRRKRSDDYTGPRRRSSEESITTADGGSQNPWEIMIE